MSQTFAPDLRAPSTLCLWVCPHRWQWRAGAFALALGGVALLPPRRTRAWAAALLSAWLLVLALLLGCDPALQAQRYTGLGAIAGLLVMALLLWIWRWRRRRA